MHNEITEQPFGVFENREVIDYTISNAAGMRVSVINYGAIITKIMTADRHGHHGNVILGFDTVDGYVQNGNQYLGCIVGRYCNRIAGARFTLGGKEYMLAANDKGNSLHGGNKGFDKKIWDVEKMAAGQSLKLTYFSADGEEGYPGNLKVEVVYTLTDQNELKIDYSAQTDQSTPVNLTSHCYFNLSAGERSTILEHELTINAELFTMLNNDAIPTGKLVSVNNDRLDFRTAKQVGKDIYNFPGGYDINFVLNKDAAYAASLYDPASGRTMVMYTTEPGLQFYSGNFLHKAVSETNDEDRYITHAALCLEAQHFPNSPNEPDFPSTILKPGEIYRQTTIYKFSAG